MNGDNRHERTAETRPRPSHQGGFRCPTVATAVLAHSVTAAHQLQDRVEVAADGLEAPPEGVQPPLVRLVFGRGDVGDGCGLLGRLADGSVAGEEGHQQQRSDEGPAGHPAAG